MASIAELKTEVESCSERWQHVVDYYLITWGEYVKRELVPQYETIEEFKEARGINSDVDDSQMVFWHSPLAEYDDMSSPDREQLHKDEERMWRLVWSLPQDYECGEETKLIIFKKGVL